MRLSPTSLKLLANLTPRALGCGAAREILADRREIRADGDKRIAEMDAAGIDMQVLSLNSPGVEQAETAEQLSIVVESNDFLAAAVKKNPRRFARLCSLGDRGTGQSRRGAGSPGPAGRASRAR